MSHAILSPSAASRWLACTPSARLEQQVPDKGSEAAAEGTLAHSLAELELRMALGRIVGKVYKAQKAKLCAEKYYDHAMEEYVGAYASYVMEQYNEARATTPDAKIFLEEKLDLTAWVPEGFGTGDVVIIADGTLRIIDLKYGKGVPVSAVENKQMMLYALGAYSKYEVMYDLRLVHQTICQPRLDSTSNYIVPTTELLTWATNELAPKAALAFAGEGEYKAGEHCRFCKVKATCRANAEFNTELAKHDFKPGPLLTDEEISVILGRVDLLVKWANAVQEHALEQALAGKRWPGWKLVEGRSNRQYGDAAAVEKALLLNGMAEDAIYSPRALLGITALEKNLGKSEFSELVGPMLIKPAGKPALVPAADKRPEYNSVASAVADFADAI